MIGPIEGIGGIAFAALIVWAFVYAPLSERIEVLESQCIEITPSRTSDSAPTSYKNTSGHR